MLRRRVHGGDQISSMASFVAHALRLSASVPVWHHRMRRWRRSAQSSSLACRRAALLRQRGTDPQVVPTIASTAGPVRPVHATC